MGNVLLRSKTHNNRGIIHIDSGWFKRKFFAGLAMLKLGVGIASGLNYITVYITRGYIGQYYAG